MPDKIVTSGGVTTSYVHDQADKWQELRDGGGALLVDLGYDGNGNRVSANTDTFVYDWANRLTQATVGGTNASFAYLADGTRASKTSGTTTPYLYDRAAGLPVVVDDGAGGYVHGPAGLLEEAGANTTWALADGLGSVRARADGAGAVVGTADWDAFGNVRSSSGASGAFGWAGEQADPETGFTYLRSRYYSPGVGRFLTPDVLSQSGAGTQGFNRYAYANNNPVTYADPSGYAAGLAGLGQAVAGVFGYIAAVLDCYLHGECRYRRQHAAAMVSMPASGLAAEVRHWNSEELRTAYANYPPRPTANLRSAGPVLAGPVGVCQAPTAAFPGIVASLVAVPANCGGVGLDSWQNIGDTSGDALGDDGGGTIGGGTFTRLVDPLPALDCFKRPFSEDNYRENLACLTGVTPAGHAAHHVFPRKFSKQFERWFTPVEGDMSIHDPRFLAWVTHPNPHLNWTSAYNRAWEAILNDPTTGYGLGGILDKGRELAAKYGFAHNLNY